MAKVQLAITEYRPEAIRERTPRFTNLFLDRQHNWVVVALKINLQLLQEKGH
jgi:hypothetical protein